MVEKSDSRGWDVVPTFVGGSFVDPRLFQQMEDHPESPGKSSWGTRNIIQAFVLSLRPRTILEIGGHIGSASVVIGSALKANNFGTLFTLEPQDHYFRLISDFIQEAGLSRYVTPLKVKSSDPELRLLIPDKIDMIFLDANHSYSSALYDLELCYDLLADHGVLFLDDVGREHSPAIDPEGRGGVRQALIDFALARVDITVQILDHPAWLNPCGLGIAFRGSGTS